MTPATRRLLRLVNARKQRMTPDMARAYTVYIKRLRATLTDERVASMIDMARAQPFRLDLLTPAEIERAFGVVSSQVRQSIETAFNYGAADVAQVVRLPVADVRASVRFDVLNPRVRTAIQTMESKALGTLSASVQKTVRQTVDAGLQAGAHPRVIARDLRAVIGLAPHQAQYVQNMRAELESLDPDVLKRVLRDKRFDRSIRQAIEDGKPIPTAKIDAYLTAYERKWTAYNTMINTRAATIQSYKVGNHEAQSAAVASGIIDGTRYVKYNVHSPVPKEPRPDHLAADGVRIPWDQPFFDGNQQLGADAYNCYCLTAYDLLPLPAAA